MALQRPQGTNDLLPSGSPTLKAFSSARGHEHVIGVARGVLERAGAQFMATPMFEEAEVVKRGVGGSTDIVRKEMFTVFYQGEHGGYVLRPEGTAPIVRAYIQNGLKQLPAPLKLWTTGAMFRAERNQQGRYRQFHQVDYEVLGSTDPLVDAEAIALMVRVVEALGLTGVGVKLGSIGDPEDRERYNAYLRELFTPERERLSGDSQDRLDRNPMRILDSKSDEDQRLIAGLHVQPMLAFLGEEARAHFEVVQGYLRAWGVPFEVDPSIVRGLDYYRRTAWELHHAHIGAKSALGGGGRYDGLAAQLGGPETPGIGWAFGVERLLIAMEQEGLVIPEPDGPALFLAAMDAENVPLVARVAMELRADAHVEFAYRAMKPGAAFKEADRKRARYAAVVGSNEAATGVLRVKALASGAQADVPLADLAAFLAQ
ncbi:histidine--tRNA ligase [Deinococcus maricopensis]|uniref:Histidine--tRNA ligase n=1 Tax=Deinococcus maricopensis (strain DSM 21211 / LMG 22137 / NRRL B-23946 / LB-34) TaxID=709986 RepID=E8U8T7_DEIML|nr:histidine--tRNA ligase [Deinococcus maricopensis]ADV67476.1 Histidyl-tRNA synthetase [Deinococcus maricopensis DSM 21211]